MASTDVLQQRPPGRFFALDGPDGGGKTTQVARLVDWLRGRGVEVVACRDPGGTPLGERIGMILRDRASADLSLRAEMLLFMASRAQLVSQVIGPALEEGKVVISDRFLLANVVYQGYAGGLDVEELWRIGRAATGGLLPDLTLLIDVPSEVAAARIAAPRDRIEDRPAAYHARVREGFLRAAETYPAPIVVVDGAADPDAVEARLRSEVAHALAIDPGP